MSYIHSIKGEFQAINIETDATHYGEHVLYLDGAWQYNSLFEYRYHETMALIPACTVETLSRVLICGGGDGLAAREILRFKNVEVDLVEICPDMLRLYRTDKALTLLNKNSLNSPHLTIYQKDAVEFARSCAARYDIILLDFPSPIATNESKGYNGLFNPDTLELFLGLLQDWGVLCAQTSVATDVLVPYVRRLLDRGFYVWNYDSVYNRRGQHDNFTTACKRSLKKCREIPREARLITEEHLKVGLSPVTEASEARLDYHRLFEFVEGIEVESF